MSGTPAVTGSGAEVVKAPGAAGRRLGIVTVDQAVSGGSNLLIVLLAAQLLDVASFGLFWIVLLTYGLVVAAERALLGDVLLAHATRAQDSAGDVIGLTIILGLVTGALTLVGGLLLRLADPRLGDAFIALAVCVPFLLLQDIGRYIGFATLAPARALVIDTVWLVLLLIGMCLPVGEKNLLPRMALFSLLVIGSATSYGLAKNWRDSTQADDALVRRLAAEIPSDIAIAHCRVLITGNIPDRIAPWIDPALKAQWPRLAGSQHCGFFVEHREAHYQILPASQCDTGRLPDSEYRQFQSQPLYKTIGSVCQTGMLPPDKNQAGKVVVFRP